MILPQSALDPWCHFNEEGNRLLCEAIVPEILRLLDQQQSGQIEER
jgi:hypothetical protein